MPKNKGYRAKNSSNPRAGRKVAKKLPLHTKLALGKNIKKK